MKEEFVQAQYQGPFNPPEDDSLAWGRASIPVDRTTAEGVTSYLRFACRCSDRNLRQFIWKGQRYDSMGEKLNDSKASKA